jgi:hypothetical protein
MRLFAVLFALVVTFLGLAPAQAAVKVHVDLSTQTMHVTSSSGEAYVWKVSSGRKGFSTPRGAYRAQRLARMHYSRKYDNAPMPHSIFFRGGYAIHATGAVGQLGSPASHGCIRLSPAHAAQLYAMVQREGAHITIGGSAPQTMTASRGTKTRVARSAAKSRSHAGQGDRELALRARYGEPALSYAPAVRSPSLSQWLSSPAR